MTRQASVTSALVLPKSAQTVQAKSHFEPKLLLKLFLGAEEEFREIQTQKIEDAEDNAFAAKRLREVRSLGDKVDGYYEELARPHLEALKRLRSLVKPFQNLVALGVAAYGGAIEAYAVEQAEERAAALEAARDAAGARQSSQVTLALNAAEEARPQKLEGVATPLEWQIDSITEPGAVPRVWCCPDVKAIAEHAKQCRPDPLKPPVIAGVKFKLAARLRVTRGR